jgi:hypothetical protein
VHNWKEGKAKAILDAVARKNTKGDQTPIEVLDSDNVAPDAQPGAMSPNKSIKSASSKWKNEDRSPTNPAKKQKGKEKNTVGKVGTDHQYQKFSSTDHKFFCTVAI